MADERTTMQQSQSETKVARGADGREMSALSYAAIYRQKLKEEQVRRISESKLRPNTAGEDAEKEQEKENRRLAMEARLREEREAVAARNAAADAVLTGVAEREAEKAAAKAAAEQAAAEQAAAEQAEREAASAPQEADVPKHEPAVAEPAVKAPAASEPKPAEETIPAPVLRRAPVAPTASAASAVPTPRAVPTAPKPAAPSHHTAPTADASLSCVVEIKGGDMQMVTDDNGVHTYTVLPETEDDGVLYITGDEIAEMTFGAQDEDIVYLTEDGEPAPAAETAASTSTAAASEAPETPVEEPVAVADEAPAEQAETVYTGEPKRHVDDLEDGEAKTPSSHRKNKKSRKQRKQEAMREANRRAHSLRETREQEEARLAEEAVRAALAPEQEMTPSRATQEEQIRRLMARKEADRAVADAMRDAEAAHVAQLKAEAEAEEQAITRANNEKREAQRAAFEAARAAAAAKEEALLAEQIAAETAAQEKQAADREAYEASVRELTERVMADELSAEEERAARARRIQDADAVKNVRIAAAKAERDSERDRALAERAEDAALSDRSIKDWRSDYVASEEGAETEEVERVEEEPVSGPRRIEPRSVSYTRRERRAMAEEAEQRRLARIAAEVALWNERETEESAYAALPEGVEMRNRRELKALFREQIKPLEKLNRTCTKTLLLLKRKISSPVAVRAGYEAIVAEREMIESLTAAIKIARLGKIRGHIRPLARRMAKEIRRERKFIKYQTALAGFAPVPCDPTMPKAVRKKLPYKLPTMLYRTEEDTGARD